MEQEQNNAAQASVSARGYVPVWIALLALTGLSVAVAELHLGSISTLTALAVATVKAGLVLWFFMHLRHEGPLLRVLLLAPLATLGVILMLTFLDIWYR